MRFLRILSAAAVATVLCFCQQGPGSASVEAIRWLNIVPLAQQVFSIHQDVRSINVLYACTHRGLYRTSNAGMTWMPIFNSDLNWLSFAQSKSAPNVMYVGAVVGRKGAVFKSVDAGSLWQQVGVEDVQGAIRSVQVDPSSPDMVYVTSGTMLFKTQNGGRTWANVSPHASSPIMPSPPDLTLMIVDQNKPGHLLANYDKRVLESKDYGAKEIGRDCSNVWESEDGGLSWRHTTTLVFTTHDKRVASNWAGFFFHPADPRVIAGIVGGDTWGGERPPIVVVSRDSGATWNDARINEVAQPYREWANTRSIAWSPRTPGTIFAGTSQAVYISTEFGQNWKQILPYPASGIFAVGQDLYAVTSAGILKSTTQGRRWHSASLGLPNLARVTASEVPFSEAFEAFQEGFATTLFPLQAILGDDIYVSGSGGFLTTSDGGLSWQWHSLPSDLSTGLSSESFPNPRGPNVRQLVVAKDRTLYLNLVTGAGNVALLKATPAGKLTKITLRRTPNTVTVSPSDPNIVYITASDNADAGRYPQLGNALMKSDDAGFSWQTLDLTQGRRTANGASVVGGLRSLAISPLSTNVAYVVVTFRDKQTNTSTLAVEATSDGGTTWHDASPAAIAAIKFPNYPPEFRAAITADPKNLKVVYASLNDTLFRSADGGLNWTQLPIKAGPINDIAVNSELPQRLYAATDTGAWASDNAGTVWTRLIAGLRPDKFKKILSVGSVTIAQGYFGTYRLTNYDVAWAKAKWQELEDNPASNPIAVTQ